MPTKTTDKGREYEIDGRRLTWHPLDDEDQTGTIPDVKIPLRLKLGVILDVGEHRDLDISTMKDMLAALIPNQMDTLREMDVNDFEAMFVTWQTEYQSLSGASLGESSGSPS